MQSTSVFLFAFLLYLSHFKCDSRDNITSGNLLSKEGETLVSAGQIFELGFFNTKSVNGEFRNYVGIWYRVSPKTIVWVANRDKPIPISGKHLVIAIDFDGNLKVWDSMGLRTSYFSTELVSASSSKRTAKLFDSGNLVLVDDLSGKILWQSFDHPTDTFLPGMRMDDVLKLTAWEVTQKDPPSAGNYMFQLNQVGKSEYTILQGTVLHWKGSPVAPTNPFSFKELPSFVVSMLSNFSNDPDTRSNFSSVSYFNYTRLVMNSTGKIQLYGWDNESGGWFEMWSEPQGPCGVYATCGKFGICNSEKLSRCNCLSGFDPASPEDWMAGNYIGGCSRKSYSSCKKKSESDTFLNLHSMKFEEPDQPYSEAKSEKDCRKGCLGNCNCLAYSYFEEVKAQRGIPTKERVFRCSIWTSDLNNLQEHYTDGFNLSVRVAITHIEHAEQGARSGEKATSLNLKALIISVSLTAGIITICYVIYHRKKVARRKAKEITLGDGIEHLPQSGSSSKYLITEDDKKRIDVPFFNLKSIRVATGNFSDANKLGQGGFGPVYKGKFPQGQEMAVKRLSSHSSQGAEEFKNEVMLIAKLQHRNLVRLLGYCIEANEKILLYEYMPNKSLDTRIFDGTLGQLLDWNIRFEIILGIARGLLYLHHDSRLRIIHRDLKTSNILLDEEMNAKISDFGLARIVQGKTIEANTQKIAGTFGYLSPEYALEGLFSIKSDVFAFGVVVLEIISGKRNLELFEGTNLLGHAWKLWMENRALDMMDPTLLDTFNESEVVKCINVALLCVQEDSGDRPTMSNVIIMLGSESMPLPRPNQPAFVTRRNTTAASTSSSSSYYKPPTGSNNALTITVEQGR